MYMNVVLLVLKKGSQGRSRLRHKLLAALREVCRELEEQSGTNRKCDGISQLVDYFFLLSHSVDKVHIK